MNPETIKLITAILNAAITFGAEWVGNLIRVLAKSNATWDDALAIIDTAQAKSYDDYVHPPGEKGK